MLLTDTRLDNKIQDCINQLNQMVAGQGRSLTDPNVVQKSMELDQLILKAMRAPYGYRN